MSKFLKMTLATMLGLLLFNVIAFFIVMGVAGSIASMSQDKEVKIKSNSVLELKLSGELVEKNNNSDITDFISAMDDSRSVLALNDIKKAIAKAAKNDKIDGIYLNCGMFAASPASLSEIRQSLLDFKKSGKFIVAYADNYTQGTYYLASLADKILLNPKGQLYMPGLSLKTMYYKDLLDKLGIDMQIFRVGTYKSAVEPFMQMHMSDANRVQLTRLADGIWNNFISEMATSRGLDTTAFNTFANNGDFLKSADTTVQRHFVDTLVYRTDVKPLIKKLADDTYSLVKIKDVLNAPEKEKYEANKIAVYYAYGEIDGGSDDNKMKSEDVVKDLHELSDNNDVKAVVLRVNSPGGSAYGSEQMWHAVTLLKAKKPVIVSMGDYAASGGYYMSCAADTIVAEPNTLTGSIGIFGMIPSGGKLMDKIGVSMDGVKTNKFSDIGRFDRPFTDSEKALFQNYINEGYATFINRVANGRHLTTDSVNNIAQGRVWLGSDAKKIGLVDVLGGLDSAIVIAAKKADVESYSVAEYPKEKDFITKLMDAVNNQTVTKILQNKLGSDYKYYEQVESIKNMKGAQALMPMYLSVE